MLTHSYTKTAQRILKNVTRVYGLLRDDKTNKKKTFLTRQFAKRKWERDATSKSSDIRMQGRQSRLKRSNIAAGYYDGMKSGASILRRGEAFWILLCSPRTHLGLLFASIVHTWVAGAGSKGSFKHGAQKGIGSSTEAFSVSQLEWAAWLAQMLHTGANLCLSWGPWKLDFLCRGGWAMRSSELCWRPWVLLLQTTEEHPPGICNQEGQREG